ncbi:hypothetical protein CBS147343_1494 [Aspergillus niger]|nr:hypothetical protein CBS133816_4864 [Aspergillus niger]KAI2891817.1 hypothetical protein CBS13152_5105 [Aspergillus niger]KAI2921680.1 hypothetical protein CBS147371_2598 [Aspergillus niger]KAI2968964.1 hypothetical protein CBS147324_6207 [Aspergillus niger]KAI2970368.1 hypothetical protein CBS147323_3492 [Aspergillus niger]
MVQNQVFIAVDFGAYKTIITILTTLGILTTWATRNANDGIIPSIFKYNSNGQLMWGRGAAASRGREPYIWVKLMLDGSPDMVTQHQNLRDILGGTVELNNIGTGKIISDFLRDLRDRLWMDLRDSADCKSTGVSPSQIAGQTAAVWSFAAAEGAADEYRNGNGMQDGDILLVCDCGGSTTDISVLRVNGNNENRPFTFQRLGDPTSIRCGGFDVDLELVQQLRTAHPDLPRNSRQWVGAAQARQDISSVKEQFSGMTGTEVHAIRIQLQRRLMIDHRFYHNDLVRAFAPTVQGILRAIHARIAAPMDARITKIILAGGLGKSAYLRRRVERDLTRAYQNTGPRLLGELQHSVQAVSRGAALYATRLQGVRGFQSNTTIQVVVPFVVRIGNELREQSVAHVIIQPGLVPSQDDFPVRMRFLVTAPEQYVRVCSIRQAQTHRLALHPITDPARDSEMSLEHGQQGAHEYLFRVYWRIQLGTSLFMRWSICLENPRNPDGPHAPVGVVNMLHRIPPEDLQPFPAI